MIGRVAGVVLLAGLWTVAPALAESPAETVCIQCHSGQGERLAAPVTQWRQSVHAGSGISCHDCHGGDPTDFTNAMSPARGFIGAPEYAGVPDFCGRCHVGVRQDYGESAHGRAVERGGAQCVICHGSHAVNVAQIDLINEQDCSRCHEYGRAGEIKAAMIETERRIGTVETELARLQRLGIATSKMKGPLFALRNRFHRLFHSVEIAKVRHDTAGFQAELDKIVQQV
ncbi:MAG: cytochrome c3 family protein, partial [Desulfuromonadales bacterium]|nr:cytochrome c3 family protein [Desulfuromonadales bacterium]